ncbi:MAG: hypothetical protein EBZ95_06805 [Chitinophagia bacterium]|jgi:hypothetical protein|nr:hypothetical protein [Chitinophagia bacterium]
MWLAILNFFNVYRDIKVYRDYLNVIKKEYENSPIWVRKGMRIDWFGRIYTVVNLPPEVILSSDLPKEARPSFVMSEIKPINDYFKKINIEELITLWLVPVKDTNEESYLVVYQYVFRELSWIWIFRFILEICLILFAISNRSYIINLF